MPARAPLACGALGSYERDRVQRMAELFGTEPVFTHEDESSVLILDREPLRWGGDRQHGLGWIEGDARRPRRRCPIGRQRLKRESAGWPSTAAAASCTRP